MCPKVPVPPLKPPAGSVLQETSYMSSDAPAPP